MGIAVNGCEISCDVSGSGPALVLIHGLGGSKQIWSRLCDRLAGSYTVVAYDLRGSGQTRELEPADGLSLTVWSDDLRGLLGALELSRPVLVGHSLGASIALKYALRWPEDVAALVLMGADPELARLGPRLQKAVELIGQVGMSEWVERHWSQNTPFSGTSLERDPGILEEYRALVLANEPGNYTRACLAIASAEPLTDELPGIRVPALVIAGSEDDRTLPDAGRELAERLGNGSFVELDGVGHTMPLEAPDGVGAAIVSFLASSNGR
jgi:pimeloyl-ACP methyl ester carboxylesterase